MTIPGNGDEIWEMAVSLDGDLVATATEKDIKSDEGAIVLWDAQNGHKYAEHRLFGQRQRIRDLVFTRDGKTLATADSRTITLRHIPDLAPRRELTSVTEEYPDHMVFDGDGQTLLASYEKGRLILWDVDTKQSIELVSLRQKTSLSDMALSFDNSHVALNACISYYSTNEIGCEESSIRIINFNFDGLRNIACSKANRNLSKDEFAKYVELKDYRKTCDDLPLNTKVSNETPAAVTSSKRDSVFSFFQKIFFPSSNLDVKPQKEITEQKADRLIDEGFDLIKQGELGDAIATYERALELDAGAPIPFYAIANLCGEGVLNGYASRVLQFCERAANEVVVTVPSDTNFLLLRGMARAITGDYAAAIADVKRVNVYEGKTNENDILIEELEAKRNPFGSKTLQALKKRYAK